MSADENFTTSSGQIFTIRWDHIDDTWTVVEDPEHRKYLNRSDAQQRAEELGL